MPVLAGLGEAAERGAQALTEKVEGTSLGKTVLNLAGNQEWELELSPGGRAIKTMNNEYIKLHDQALKGELNKLQEVRNWHSNDPAAKKALPIKTATMGEYHAHAVATGHPIEKVTKSILDAHPDNAGLTQKELMIRNERLAKLKGIAGSYGENFDNAAPIIAEMRKHPDPRMQDHAQRVADIISNQTHDTQDMHGFPGQYQPTSFAKVSLNRNFAETNKLLEEAGEDPIKMLNTDPTYEKPAQWERKANSVLDTVMLPFLSIKHIGQFFALPASSPLSAIGKSLFSMNHEEMRATIDASAITASTLWRSMYRDILGETGKVSEWTDKPEVGKILARTIHQPGFTWMRKLQLNTAGTVGYHSAIQWAHNFAKLGDRTSELRLRELEIDPDEVKAQGGKLNEEQLQKAIYHYTNNRLFFNKHIDSSLWQNRNLFARSMFMYHSFVGSETAYLRRELLLLAKAGDYKSLAQFAGTMFVLFPQIAPLIGGAEKLLQTGSPTQAKEEVEERYSRFWHPRGTGDWLANYATLLSHLGAAGVYFNYVNAIKGHRLATAMLGPLLGAGVTDISDIVGAATGGSAKPLERDVLRQTVPVVGPAASHLLAPTTAEGGSGRRRTGGKFGGGTRIGHSFGRRR